MSDAELTAFAARLVNRVVLTLMDEAGLKKAIDKLKRDVWSATLDSLTEDVAESLRNVIRVTS